MATSQPSSSPSSTVSFSDPTTSTSPDAADSTQTFVTDTDHTLANAVLATNSISVAACVFAITSYFILRHRNPRMMARTSLKISVAMACSDTIYHSANLAGYGYLPPGFICAFVGGWLFTTPSFTSTFYAAAIALNTQLVFVHKRIPKPNKQILYLVIPPILAILISTPTLFTGVYGFDDVFQYCWYTTDGVSTHTILIRVIMTWSLWISLALVYLIFAVILITYSLFSKKGVLSGIGMPRYLKRHPSMIRTSSTDADAALAVTLQRRDMARRALTVRVLGYISVPVICVFPGVIIDLIARSMPDLVIPSVVPLIAAITAGLMGTFNAILLSFDPSVVAVVFWPRWKKKQEQEKLRQNLKARRQPEQPSPSTRKQPALGDVEMAESKARGDETQGAVVTTIHFHNADDHGLEFYGHSAMHDVDTIDLENSRTSTIGYDMSDLAETYHGL